MIDSTSRIIRTEVVDLVDADLAEIHDLRTRAGDFFAELGDPPPTPESFQADLDDPPDGYTRADEVIYRAYQGRRPAGYAEVLRGYAYKGQWIVGIVLVDSTMRSGGIGHDIVRAILIDARACGVESLAAGVIVTRERSLAFWSREGFTTEVSRRPILVDGRKTHVVRLELSLQG